MSLQNRGRGLYLPLLICALCHFVASFEVLYAAWLFPGSSLLLYRASDGKKTNDFQEVLCLPNTIGEAFAQLEENTDTNNLD